MRASASPVVAAGDPGAGGGLLDVRVVVALAVLLVNDHVLKAALAGTAWSVVTGKLSDFAGVLFLPVLVVAAMELLERLAGRYQGPRPRAAAVVAVGVAVAFVLMKTTAVGSHVYAVCLGALQWPFFTLRALMEGAAPPPLRPVAHVADPSDAVAVVVAPYVWWQTRRRAAAAEAERVRRG